MNITQLADRLAALDSVDIQALAARLTTENMRQADDLQFCLNVAIREKMMELITH